MDILDIQNSIDVDYREVTADVHVNTVKVDAETQTGSPLTRSIGIQTLKTKSHYPLKKRQNSSVSAAEVNSCSLDDHFGDHTYCRKVEMNEGNLLKTDTAENMALCSDVKTGFEDSDSEEIESSMDDSDVDYTYTNTDESSETETEDENDNFCETDWKFIVYYSKINELLRMCQQCGSPVCEVGKKNVGSMITITTLCLQHNTYRWNSQPLIANSIPFGNIQIPAAIVCSGTTYQEISSFTEAFKLKSISETCFYKVQNSTVLPVIDKVYKEQQLTLIDELKIKKAVNLCGDGRSDSPGHNAKYDTYSLMDEDTNKIVDFSLVQVSEVSSSNAMEYEGCKRSLNKLLNLKPVPIRCLTTNRHIQITAQLKKKLYPNYTPV